MNKALAVGGLVGASLLVGALIVMGPRWASMHEGGQQAARQASGPPWQIETLPNGGIRVMGLTLSTSDQSSSLADVLARWGQDVQVAVIAAPGEDGTLEAFVDPASAGFISGKAVVTLQASPTDVRGMRERAIKSEFMESTTRKYTLAPADLQAAMKSPVIALSFIPQANLDAETVLARFGTPAERMQAANGHVEHFLYPPHGLDVALDAQGKELLQYVAPARFDERLRQPLKQGALGAAQAASAP